MAETQPAAEELSVRSTIEQCAMVIFARKGYHTASVREIVEAAGVTAPTLYYHFGSKEGLYNHLIDRLVQRMQQRVEAVHRAGGTIRTQLVTLLRAHLETMQQRPDEVRFLHRVMVTQVQQLHQPDSNPLHRPMLPGRLDGGALLRLIEDAVQRGELIDVPAALLHQAFVGTMNMHVIRRVLHGCTAPGNEPGTEGEGAEKHMHDAEQIVDLFLYGAARRPQEEQR